MTPAARSVASPVRPFRFGLILGRGQDERSALTPSAITDLGRRAEDLGFSSIVVPDHFSDQLAPFCLLTFVAAATTSLRVATLVLCNDFRHPAVLAKEAATLDVLSGGRLELGIGAGWEARDYEMTGIPMDRPGVRIDRMVESLGLLRRIFAEGPVDHEGDHYVLRGYEGFPKPVQRPHPPLFLGGGGRRMLTIAGREADIVGIIVNLQAGGPSGSSGSEMTLAGVEEKVGWIRAAAAEREVPPELSIFPFLVATDADEVTGVGSALGLGSSDVLDSPFVLAGSADEMVDRLSARREQLGISYITVRHEHMDTLAPVVAALADG